MSSRRGLISASSRSGNRRPRQQQQVEDEDSLELPPYQPPECPLDQQGQRSLKDLTHSRMSDPYKAQLDESVKHLITSIHAINECMTIRKKQAADTVEREAKRRRINAERSEDDGNNAAVQEAEHRARMVEEEVEPLIWKVEQAMRDVLDMQTALHDEKEVLGGIPALVLGAQQSLTEEAQQRAEEDEAAEPPEVPGVPIHEILENERASKAAQYNRLSMFQKYARHNSYIDFRRNWHDGLFPDEEVNLPDATTWFDQDGRPRHDVRGERSRSGGSGDEDSDEDIQIASEKRSFRCPLSLVELTEPYTCRRCKHSFQHEAILVYLQGPRRRDKTPKKCPETGCDILDMTVEDLYFDESLLRRIKRAAQAELEQEQASSDQEEEEDERNTTVNATVKPEKDDEADQEEQEDEEDEE